MGSTYGTVERRPMKAFTHPPVDPRSSRPASIEDEVILLLALADDPELRSLLEAASLMCGQRIGLESLDPTLKSGLLTMADEVLSFTQHDSAVSVVAQATPSRVRRGHQAWAAALVTQPLAQTRHRLLAAGGRNESDAMQAVEAARRYQAAGYPERCLELLRAAARLWPTPTGGAESLVEAAATAFALGRPTEGRKLLRTAALLSQRQVLHQLVVALQATFCGQPYGRQGVAHDHLAAAAKLSAWGHPFVAFSVLVNAGPTADVEKMARLLSEQQPEQCALAALVQLHQSNIAASLQLLCTASVEASGMGLAGVDTHIQTLIGELAAYRGDHAVARGALAVAHDLCVRTAQSRWSTRAVVAEASIAVLREDRNRDQLVRRAHCLALTTDEVLGARAEFLEAMALAADDRWSDAFDLVGVLSKRDLTNVRPLLPAGLLSLVADAAVHSGRQLEGRALVSRIAEVDTHCERGLELAELLYATAVLSDEAVAETCFEVALALDHQRLPWLYARTRLAYGGWLRRHRRVTESRVHLLAAQRTFDAMGLPIGARRAQAELRASGLRGRPDSTPRRASLDLSPQALEIAELVARGLSNRQIGEALCLSPRTVGSHLYRIFPKFDVTSRHQLAALLGAAQT